MPVAGAAGPACESLFQTTALVPDIAFELSQRPDDSQKGLVTEKLPINVETLSYAYERGIFPYGVTPESNGAWFNPPTRGVLDFDQIEIGRSDRKVLNRLKAAVDRGELRVTFDTAFERVIRECALQLRPVRDPRTGVLGAEGTWIKPEIIEGYIAMFKVGRAHSVEVWRGDELVAGSYGTTVGGVYSAESMFHKIDEVAKLSLVTLIERLKSLGYTWMDTQIAPADSSSLSVKWGAREIPRAEFMQRLAEAAKTPDRWPAR